MKFRKKPVVIEAMQWTGNNWKEIDTFVGKSAQGQNGILWIYTLERIVSASLCDWVIKGVKGEFYPCKPDIFDATYEAVDK